MACRTGLKPGDPFCDRCGASTLVAPVSHDRIATAIFKIILGIVAGLVLGCFLGVCELIVTQRVAGFEFEGGRDPSGALAQAQARVLAAVAILNVVIAGLAVYGGLRLARSGKVGFGTLAIATAVAMLLPTIACIVAMR